MATLKKLTTTVWRYASGKRAEPYTPGATKLIIKTKKWYIVYMEHGKVKRVPAYTDKNASQAKLADLLRASERGESGLSDPFKVHYDRAVLEHVADYHRYVAARSRSDKHP